MCLPTDQILGTPSENAGADAGWEKQTDAPALCM
jgi:hypothetical protein